MSNPQHIASSARRVADVIPKALVDVGTRLVFGVQGGAALPVFHALAADGRISVIATAHEQGAVFAADGFARVSGRAGVCLLTSGPGALNGLTALGSAYMDSVPLVVLSGQVPSHLLGTDAFQEAEVLGMSLAVTKWSAQVRSASATGRLVVEAHQNASSGRPRPALLDLPKDMMSATWVAQHPGVEIPPTEFRPSPHKLEIAVSLLQSASRPLILAGHGVLLARASPELTDISERSDAPVATTLLGLSSFDEDSTLSLGMIGMHGTATANSLLGECDVLLVVGARLDDRATGRLEGFAPQAKMIHIDIDPAELGKNREPTVALCGDAKTVLMALLKLLPAATPRPEWRRRIREAKAAIVKQSPTNPAVLLAKDAVATIGRLAPKDAIVVAGVGQHQMWTALRFGFRTSHTWLTSGGLGAMGYALPAAIGAQFAAPERTVVVIDGDGCFHMTSNELATAVQHRLRLKIFIINNGNMGMVRQWIDLFHDRNQVAVDNGHLPSFARLADAYGARGIEVRHAADLEPAIAAALSHTGGPIVVDIRVAPDEDVYPMVPPGKSNSEFITGANGA